MFRLLIQKVFKNKKNSFIHAFFKFAPMFIWPILHLSEKYNDLIIMAKQAQQESLVDRGQN